MNIVEHTGFDSDPSLTVKKFLIVKKLKPVGQRPRVKSNGV